MSAGTEKIDHREKQVREQVSDRCICELCKATRYVLAQLDAARANVSRYRDGLKRLCSALSRISYLCGEPNPMEVSDYDASCNEEAVVRAVETLCEQNTALREQIEAYGPMVDDAQAGMLEFGRKAETAIEETIALRVQMGEMGNLLTEALDLLDEARHQWSDDYLWYKWSLTERIDAVKDALARLKGKEAAESPTPPQTTDTTVQKGEAE